MRVSAHRTDRGPVEGWGGAEEWRLAVATGHNAIGGGHMMDEPRRALEHEPDVAHALRFGSAHQYGALERGRIHRAASSPDLDEREAFGAALAITLR